MSKVAVAIHTRLEPLFKFLNEDSLGICNQGETALLIPFELKAEDFLSFAKDDLQENSERSLVNALSNIKRAIDCRIATLLVYFGLYKLSKKDNWSLPRSTKFLLEIGVIAPDILNKINTKRNKLEHEFKKTTFTEVKDYYDIANLFMSFTNQFLHKNFTEFEFCDPYSAQHPFAEITLFSKEGIIKTHFATETGVLDLDITLSNEEVYKKLLRQLVKVIINR